MPRSLLRVLINAGRCEFLGSTPHEKVSLSFRVAAVTLLKRKVLLVSLQKDFERLFGKATLISRMCVQLLTYKKRNVVFKRKALLVSFEKGQQRKFLIGSVSDW
jgi:hypothetical protein